MWEDMHEDREDKNSWNLALENGRFLCRWLLRLV